MTRALIACLPLAACAALSASPSQAADFLWDFEGVNPAGAVNEAQFTILTVKDTTDTISATFRRSSGNPFSVTDLTTTPLGPCDNSSAFTSCPPTGWGSRSLSPFNAPSTPSDYFIIEFSQGVASVSIQGGDRNFDFDTTINLTAYNAASAPLGAASGLPATDYSETTTLPEIRTITYGTSPLNNTIASIHVVGGSPSGSFPSIPPEPISFFWDNLRATTVDIPPPASVPTPLPVLGAGACFAFSRKLRSRIKRSLT